MPSKPLRLGVLASVLISYANKNFDMLLLPNMYHGESGPHAAYLVRRRWDYFVQYLLGVTPPTDFTITTEDLYGPRGPRRP